MMQDTSNELSSTPAPDLNGPVINAVASPGKEGAVSLVDSVTQSYQSLLRGELTEGVSAVLQKVVVPGAMGLLGLIAGYFIAKFLAGRIAATICKRVDETLGKFVGKILFYGMMLIACIIVLSRVGVEVSGFMAVLATAGFAIGLAFQGTLSNFSAGILLLVFRPFKVGDTVNIANQIGKVHEIDIFTTVLDTLDNRRLIIPNSTITGGIIENVTFHQHRRVELILAIEHHVDTDRTRSALQEAIDSMAELIVPGENRGYQIILSNLGPVSTDWTVRIWVTREQFFAGREMLNSRVKATLAKHGIAIQCPQMQLRLAGEPITESLGGHRALDSRTVSEESSHSIPDTKLEFPNLTSPPASKVRPRHRSHDVEQC